MSEGFPQDRVDATPAPEPKPCFCARCGTKLSTAGESCEKCAARAARTDSHVHAQMFEVESASLSSVLTLYFLLLAIIVALNITLKVAGPEPSPSFQAMGDLIASGAMSLVIVWFSIRERRSILPSLGCSGGWKWLVAAPFLAVVSFVASSALLWLITRALPMPNVQYSESYVASGYGWWSALAMIAVHPAIFEELAFRGVIRSALRRTLSGREAAIVTAMLFAILHLNVVSFPNLLVMGLLLGFVREKSGSLYPCMILHACHNAIVVGMEWMEASS